MTTKTSEDNVQIGLEKHTLAFGSRVIISNPKIWFDNIDPFISMFQISVFNSLQRN